MKKLLLTSVNIVAYLLALVTVTVAINDFVFMHAVPLPYTVFSNTELQQLANSFDRTLAVVYSMCSKQL